MSVSARRLGLCARSALALALLGACAEEGEGLEALAGSWQITRSAGEGTVTESVVVDIDHKIVSFTTLLDGSMGEEAVRVSGTVSGNASGFVITLHRPTGDDMAEACRLVLEDDIYDGAKDGEVLKGAYTRVRRWGGTAADCGEDRPTTADLRELGSFVAVRLSAVAPEDPSGGGGEGSP
jgi:hypothetical protein